MYAPAQIIRSEEGHFTAVCKAETQKKGGNGTEVQKDEPKEQQRKEIQSSGSLFQDQMPYAWDRSTVWTGGVHLMTGPENSEPLIWADEQENMTELEEELMAGNA